MKTCLILRGTPNSGKSTLAEYLKDLHDFSLSALDDPTRDYPLAVVCCADDFFTDKNGNYNWVSEKLGEAHRACKQKFVEALGGSGLIIVANTNSTDKEFSFYLEEAEKAGYRIFSLVVERRHSNKNNHDVPDSSIAKIANNIKNSLKLT